MIEISWDDKKCTSPEACRRCLDECSQGVFGIYPREPRTPGKAAGAWAIGSLFPTLCTGCAVCEEFCPEGALTVTAN